MLHQMFEKSPYDKRCFNALDLFSSIWFDINGCIKFIMIKLAGAVVVLVFISAVSADMGLCPAPDGDFPNPASERCTTFFRCEGGHPRMLRCPARQAFDFLFRFCRRAMDVNCARQLQVFAAPGTIPGQGAPPVQPPFGGENPNAGGPINPLTGLPFADPNIAALFAANPNFAAFIGQGAAPNMAALFGQGVGGSAANLAALTGVGGVAPGGIQGGQPPRFDVNQMATMFLMNTLMNQRRAATAQQQQRQQQQRQLQTQQVQQQQQHNQAVFRDRILPLSFRTLRPVPDTIDPNRQGPKVRIVGGGGQVQRTRDGKTVVVIPQGQAPPPATPDIASPATITNQNQESTEELPERGNLRSLSDRNNRRRDRNSHPPFPAFPGESQRDVPVENATEQQSENLDIDSDYP